MLLDSCCSMLVGRGFAGRGLTSTNWNEYLKVKVSQSKRLNDRFLITRSLIDQLLTTRKDSLVEYAYQLIQQTNHFSLKLFDLLLELLAEKLIV